MRVLRFHQFIIEERGFKKTALIDFFNKNIYHVDNIIIEMFKKNKYNKISDFIKRAMREKILIKIDEKKWIPYLSFDRFFDAYIIKDEFALVIEKGASLELIKEKFDYFNIPKIYFTGEENISKYFPLANINFMNENFASCVRSYKLAPKSIYVDIRKYHFQKYYNSCWGKKVTITKNNKIKPCLFSDRVIGDLDQHDTIELINNLKEMWKLNKDKIEKCKDCEFRYLCFDCRVISINYNKYLYSTNPFCNYNPYAGKRI